MATNRFATFFLKLFLVGTIVIFTTGIDTFSSKNEELATDGNIKNTKPWANIDGFRSAKFGMKIKEVKKAIQQDFFIQDGKIDTVTHPTEQTQSLGITINKLLPISGKSRVVYVFGFQSKRLIQVNILVGHPADTDITPQQVVDSGNLLGNHFFKKRYQEDGLMAHARLNDGSVLIFRGKDQNGRMVLLRLSNPQSTKNKDEKMKISLTLSYIEKPLQPDAFQLKENDF
jgi:hypothetical protein